MDYWESQDLRFVESLEELLMDFEGNQNERQLINYLLRNSVKLKKMTIYYSPHKLHIAKMIGKKLQEFEKASLFAMTFLLPKSN